MASAVLGFEFHKYFLYALSAALILFSTQIFTVFILSDYEYCVDGNIFYLYRITGKKKRCIFDLDLSYASAIVRYKDAKEYVKQNGKPKRRFYCLCGYPKKQSATLFYKTDMTFALYFTPDDAVFSAISSYIR